MRKRRDQYVSVLIAGNLINLFSRSTIAVLAVIGSANALAKQTGEQVSANVIQLKALSEQSDPPVVTAISVSPLGDLIAAAGDDHAIRIVSLASGKTLSTLLGHTDWVQCVEFSPSGNQLASCGHDGTLRTWKLTDSPKMTDVKTVAHALLSLVYTDEATIYTAGFDRNIYRSTGSESKLTIAHSCDCKDIRSIASSSDGRMLAFGGRDGILRVIHLDNSEPEFAIPIHFDRIRTIRFSEDGAQVTSVGEDRRIVHVDLAMRSVVGKTEIGGGKLMGLCQLSQNMFAIAGSDNSIRIVTDLENQMMVKLVGHDGSVSILRKAGNKLVSGSFDTTIRVWDIERAVSDANRQGRYIHPVAAQFEDSGAGDVIK